MVKIDKKELELLLEDGYDFIYPDECTDCHNLGYHCSIGCIDAELDAEASFY